MSTALIAPAANLVRSGGTAALGFLLKNPAGQVLILVGLYEGAAYAWDWMFGDSTQQEEQRELIEDLIEVRKKLSDPNTPADDMRELAEQDADIQDALEDLGVLVEAAQTSSGAYSAAVVSTTEYDINQNDEYALDEISRLSGDIRKVLSIFGIRPERFPEGMDALKRLMQFTGDDLAAVMKVMGG